MVMLHIKIKGIKYAASLEQIFCPQTPTPHPDLLGSKGHNSTSSPRGYVAYQSKGNHEYSNVVANILTEIEI